MIRFLSKINRETPAGQGLRLLVDTAATHKHPKVRPGSNAVLGTISASPRLRAPGSNTVEGFFPKLTRQRLKRSVFTGIVDLRAAINQYLAETDNPKPFTWTGDPGAIIEKVRRGKRAVESIHYIGYGSTS